MMELKVKAKLRKIDEKNLKFTMQIVCFLEFFVHGPWSHESLVGLPFGFLG